MRSTPSRATMRRSDGAPISCAGEAPVEPSSAGVIFGLDGTPLLGARTGVGWYTAELAEAVAWQAPDDEVALLPISWRRAGQVSLGSDPPPNLRVERRFAPARPLWWAWERADLPPVEWLLRCDVFHATNFMAPPGRRVPIVVTVHDIGFVHRPDHVGPAVRHMARLLPAVLRRAAAVIAVSEFTRAELAAWQPAVADRIEVIPNGGHRRRKRTDAEHGLGPGPDHMLVLGTLEPRKNITLVLDAFAVLARQEVPLRLVLAGAASPLLDVDSLVAERGLDPDVVLRTGYVDDERAAALVATARMLVFPSLYEGFGMPLVEAMDAGVPIVAVRAGATPETVGDAAVLIDVAPPSDMAASLADAILRVHADEGLRARLVAAGKARASHYTWDRSARSTLEVYRRVASR
jgi:glycosyltransferase involved in cell wall biosynthesis